MMPRHVNLLTVTCLLAAALPTAWGHGFMYYPAARNVVLNSDYCPHCLAAGGAPPNPPLACTASSLGLRSRQLLALISSALPPDLPCR